MTKFILLAIGLVAVVLQGWAPDGVEWVALGLVVLVVVAIVLLARILRSSRSPPGSVRGATASWRGSGVGPPTPVSPRGFRLPHADGPVLRRAGAGSP